MELVEKSSRPLLAEMQITGNRRGIAEAESVSKLTELALSSSHYILWPVSSTCRPMNWTVWVPLYIFVVSDRLGICSLRNAS